MTVRSVGVEEELLLVEPGTRRPRAVAETALRAVRPAGGAGGEPGGPADVGAARSLDFELQRQQLETNTRPCLGLGELGREVRRCRSLAAQVAARAGARVAALATSPAPVVPQLVRDDRYLEMARAFGLTAYEQLTCGCHVHVEVSSADDGVAVLLDAGMVYFDARLSEHYPTLEIRIADVCLYADDAVLIAALARALVDTEARHWRAGAGAPRQRTEVLRLTAWRASRSGLEGDLVSPLTGLPEPAGSVANALLEHVRDALDQAGDTGTVTELLAAVLARGNGAAFQRGAHRGGDLGRMIDRAATETSR
jgi:gamma-glutamyl:cysteine ligase YbdK (ATP-grasp superfamily)